MDYGVCNYSLDHELLIQHYYTDLGTQPTTIAIFHYCCTLRCVAR